MAIGGHFARISGGNRTDTDTRGCRPWRPMKCFLLALPTVAAVGLARNELGVSSICGDVEIELSICDLPSLDDKLAIQRRTSDLNQLS